MPRRAHRTPWALYGLATFVAVSIAALFALAPNRTANAASPVAGLRLDAPLPGAVGKDTVLIVGDPVTQWVFERNGWDKRLPFTIRWAQITGGPDVTEAFHARALDVGVGANVPPLHAHWVGLPVKIVAIRQRHDPLNFPAFVWGIAPGAKITQLTDLKGKRIAFSPSQVQGLIVIQTLQALGLSVKDVTLVELPSTAGGDVYTSALASGIVDAAPIGGGIVADRYLRKFAGNGATTLRHPPFRDDITLSYVPVSSLQDPGKAAALKLYVQWWAKAQAWQRANRDEVARGYYQDDQGLSAADAKLIVDQAGDIQLPADWKDAVAYQQAAIDIIARETGRPWFDAAGLFDRRFEPLATDQQQEAK